MDKMTLIAASVPTILFLGIVIYLILQWKKTGSFIE